MGAPDIDIRLGWFCPNICCAELSPTLAFYELLGFERIGGRPEENWATLRFGSTELHLFQGYIRENLLHWRGGDIAVIAELATLRGIEAETAFALDEEGAQTLTLRDPAGNGIFFNTFPLERRMFLEGVPYTERGLPAWPGSAADRMTWVLATQDPRGLCDWYGWLGLESGEGSDPGTWELRQDSTLILVDSGMTHNRIVVSYRTPGALQDCLLRLEARGHDIDSGVLHDPEGNEVVLSDQ
ncbi:hypothetical protein KDL29_10215 [bacterium]|nr:hypothetical protein [bacterium]